MEENLPRPTNENKQVTIPLKDFQFIPKTVNEFSKTLLRYEPLNSEIQSIKKLWEIQEWAIKNCQLYCKTSKEIHFVRAENTQLRSELDLTRAMLIQFDRKLENLQSEVTDLRARVMRDNIPIYNLTYKQGEILMQIILETIKETLRVDVKFLRTHSNIVNGVVHSKPVSITEKVVD